MDIIRRSVLIGGSDVISQSDKYLNSYFTIEALESGLSVCLSTTGCEYCVDNDGNWKTLSAYIYTVSINAGQTLSFRGNLNPVVDVGIGTFTISKKCNLKGNIMSLLYGDNFADKTDLTGKDYAFYNLFKNCTTVINTINLILPATTLVMRCYSGMFRDCTGLISAPELPATTLTSWCYTGMFWGCTSLTTAPELPAYNIDERCYYYMFKNCYSLVNAPKILPATKLYDACYSMMFEDCHVLETAPELPAIDLVIRCYRGMFSRCYKLSYIKALFTYVPTIESYPSTFYWVDGVSNTGTFVKNKNANIADLNSSSFGYSGIPTGWTVINNE